MPGPIPTYLGDPRRSGDILSLRPETYSISLYGPGEAEGDAVGNGDGEAAGDDVGSPVVVGTGVVVVWVVRSGRGGGSYGPLSAADNAAATTTAASEHAGARTTTRGRRTNGRTQPPKWYHKSAANTTTTVTDSHHGCPKINGPLTS